MSIPNFDGHYFVSWQCFYPKHDVTISGSRVVPFYFSEDKAFTVWQQGDSQAFLNLIKKMLIPAIKLEASHKYVSCAVPVDVSRVDIGYWDIQILSLCKLT